MAKSNYDILEQNKSETLLFASSIVAQPKPTIPIDTTTTLQSAKDALKNGDFSKAVMLLDEIKDNKLGIKWSESENLGNGTKSRVRDARNVTNDPVLLKKEQGEKYAMQILNEVQAAIKLLDKNDPVDVIKTNEAKQKLQFLAEKALNNIDKLGPGEIEKYNTQIISTIEKAGVSDAEAKLDFAKGMMTFQHEHVHIVTLSNAKDNKATEHTVLEAEIMLNGLTPKLKQQYEAIRDSTPPGSNVMIQGVNMDWYNKLPLYKKELVHEASAKIVTGNYVIPTPMLSVLPGVRNGYDKVTAVKSPNKELEIVNDTLHCGAPASSAKLAGDAGKQAIADLNIEQLQSFSENGKVTLNVLNSGILGLEKVNEGYIFSQLQTITKREGGVNFAASPINDWRKVPGAGRDHTKFLENLKNIGQDIKNTRNLKNIGTYLSEGNNSLSKKVSQELETLKQTNPELARTLRAAVEAKSLINTPAIFEKSNVNLAVTNKISIVETALMTKTSELSKIVSESTRSTFYKRVDFCKSGKDRTGYVETKNTSEAVASYLGVDPSSKLGKENLFSQVAAGHTQEMAGIQGGTMGCHSIKQSFVFSLIKNDKAINGILNQKTSNYNAIKVVKKKQKAAVLEEFEKEFAQQQNQTLSSPVLASSKSRDAIVLAEQSEVSVLGKDGGKVGTIKPQEVNQSALRQPLASSGKLQSVTIDPLALIRQEVISKQAEILKNAAASIHPEIDKLSPKEFKEYLEKPGNKQKVEQAFENSVVKEDLEKAIQKAEIAGYKKFNEEFAKTAKAVEWDSPSSKANEKLQIVKNKAREELCTLVEKTVNVSRTTTLPDGSTKKQEVSARTIEFPTSIKEGSGPMHASFALKDEHGQNMPAEGAVYFTAHYDKSGKLTEVSSPQPVKFMGSNPETAVGYIERNGQIYTLPVTQKTYENMMKKTVDLAKQEDLAKDHVIVTAVESPVKAKPSYSLEEVSEKLKGKTSAQVVAILKDKVQKGNEELVDLIVKATEQNRANKADGVPTLTEKQYKEVYDHGMHKAAPAAPNLLSQTSMHEACNKLVEPAKIDPKYHATLVTFNTGQFANKKHVH